MKTYFAQIKSLFHDKNYMYQLFASGLLLLLGFIASALANGYATAHMGPAIPDIFVWGVSTDNVVIPYIWSIITFATITTMIFIWRPKTIPFLMFALALFCLIRSGFIILTNPGLPEGIVGIDSVSPFIKKYFFGGDLFFSGHAGAPFLMALAFWNYNKIVRTTFLALSIGSAIIVLVGHYHYSVDVAGAYFITYTIYEITKHFFTTSLDYFKQGAA